MPVTEQDTRPLQLWPEDRARTRINDPITSHQAADSNQPADSRAEVMDILRRLGPLADHELVVAHELLRHPVRFTPQRLRTARSELVELGQVAVVEGKTRMTPTGRNALVWAVATKGQGK